MRNLVTVFALLAAGTCDVYGQASEHCRYYGGDFRSIEWLEDSKSRGARLVLRSDQWQMERGYGHTILISYKEYSKDHVISGAMQFDLPLYWSAEKLRIHGADRLDVALAPENIDLGLALMSSDNIHKLGLRGVTDPVSVTFAGLAGRARVVAAEIEGRSHYVIAVAAELGCFSFFGVFSALNQFKVAVEQLEPLASAIEVEWYKPNPSTVLPPSRPPPPDECAFPLGSARQRCEQQQR